MNEKIRNLLEIAVYVLPPIGALIKDDEGEELAKDVAAVVEAVIGHVAPEKQKKAVEDDPALQIRLRIEIEEAANRKAAEDNRALEVERSRILERERQRLAKEQNTHEEDLDKSRKELDSAEASRAYATKSAASESWWISGINPFLSIVIVLSFFFFLYLIAKNPIGEKVFVNSDDEVISVENVDIGADGTFRDAEGGLILQRVTGNNLEVFYIAFGALATAFVTVVGFHFGSSSGSKRKTQLQRLYGTRGTLSGVGAGQTGKSTSPSEKKLSLTSGTATVRETIVAATAGKVLGAKHPFEQFWNENLSHIEHFNWREVLEKGASKTGVGLNTDPPRELYQNVVPLVNALDRIRGEIGAPIQLTSVYRSPEYNRHVGGVSDSRHMQFDAADFRVLGGRSGDSGRWSQIAKRMRKKGVFRGGVGVYTTFVHIDTRGSNADWDRR
ncbi:D-Ala-D-Ala carboxypeptidase family metallohydrolase [uncultured Roseobacter sp.]|uniref:YcbK family protein n=1 Tax=uncultured Roseobacter sp. TaxID=114847 RepID=UPI002607EDDC|nr:D-Ala-D-Ala carboxypeptidase family metallohydrolase [uncultured Roseobacter sp.]